MEEKPTLIRCRNCNADFDYTAYNGMCPFCADPQKKNKEILEIYKKSENQNVPS
jgi:Zn finger protein HypA/HybF involved in hydrogenase expression